MASRLLDEISADDLNAQQIKKLLLPGEMGERFKVLLLTRDIDSSLPGRDMRERL